MRVRFIAVMLVALFASGCGYNSIQGADEQVKAAWSEVGNQYQRRADLIQNLVNTVKGAADFERETLEAVVNARAKATSIQVGPEMLENPEAFRQFALDIAFPPNPYRAADDSMPASVPIPGRAREKDAAVASPPKLFPRNTRNRSSSNSAKPAGFHHTDSGPASAVTARPNPTAFGSVGKRRNVAPSVTLESSS